MERLTKRLEDGQAIFHECHGTCGTCDGANCYCIGPMVDRLAAYEDTGLAPEEISDAVIAAKLMAKSKIVSCFGVDADHIRELVQAEQDGRLVVLPCKVGDTVYQIDAERVYESEVKWIIFDCDDIAFDERAIGGSIFLTREEAEAALAQKGDSEQ